MLWIGKPSDSIFNRSTLSAGRQGRGAQDRLLRREGMNDAFWPERGVVIDQIKEPFSAWAGYNKNKSGIKVIKGSWKRFNCA